MSRFFCLPEEVSEGKIIIKQKSQIHHIVDVMRQKEGDAVAVFDGTGKQYFGRIKKVSAQEVVIEVNKIEELEECPKKICLACAIPKKAKFDFIIEKVTELGVDEIIPMVTGRTIVKLDRNASLARVQRWQKIALEAAKQCGRKILPKITGVQTFAEAVTQIKNYELALIPHLLEGRKELRELDFSLKKSVIIFVGPEGDFTPSEINLALKTGCLPISLGSNVLKVDTAAIFSVGILSYLMNKI